MNSASSKIKSINNRLWTQGLYSDILRNLYKKRVKWIPWLKPFPRYVEIEVTTRCNLKCVMCEHTYWKEPIRDMSFDEFKHIVDQFPGLKWAGLTGIGESFLNKDFLNMVRYLRSKHISVELSDNFFLVNEKIARELLEAGLELVYLSLDAATKETYEKIRVNSKWDTVIKNFKNFIKMRDEMGLKKPHINFYYVVLKNNMHEMLQYLDLVNSFNLDRPEVCFTPLLHAFKEAEHLSVKLTDDLIEKVEDRGKELGIKISWNQNVHKLPPINKCYAWLMPYIFPTGHVVACCAVNEANQREYRKKTALGNIYEKSFKEIWNDEAYTTLRKKISRGEVPIQCKYCPIYDVGAKK